MSLTSLLTYNNIYIIILRRSRSGVERERKKLEIVAVIMAWRRGAGGR
jgi:hypothetical protein